jgi:hypothetical protein
MNLHGATATLTDNQTLVLWLNPTYTDSGYHLHPDNQIYAAITLNNCMHSSYNDPDDAEGIRLDIDTARQWIETDRPVIDVPRMYHNDHIVHP